MLTPPGQHNRKSRASSTKYFTSLSRKVSRPPDVEQPPPPPQPPQPPPQLQPPPPAPPSLPQPQGPPGHSVVPGSNKPNLAHPVGRRGFAVVQFPPLAPPGIHKAQPSHATAATSSPWSKMSEDEDELYEGGWTRCVLHICGCFCLLVAVIFVLILYLFIMRLMKQSQTAAWQSDATDYNSTRPVTGNISASSTDATLVGRDNSVLVEPSTNAEELYSISVGDAD